MATYFPPQQLHGETDSVYDTIRGLGGVLYMPPGNANGVNQFVYPDDSTLAGTVAGVPTFDQSGLVPEILGGNPQATFVAGSDKINFTVPLGDPLQMSGGGTWITCVTVGTLAQNVFLWQKSTSDTATRNGFGLFFRYATKQISVTTSSNSTTGSTLDSPADAFVFGERFLLTFTLDAAGNAKTYKNGTEIASDTGLQLPTDIAGDMAIGNGITTNTKNFVGSVDCLAGMPGVVLTQPQIATIAAQCGPLG